MSRESEEFFYDKDRFPPPGAIDWDRVAGESIYQAARPLNVGIGLTLYRMASIPVFQHTHWDCGVAV